MTVLLPLLLALLGALPSGERERFPHDVHARLFPLCSGCHAGIERAGAELYPVADDCVRCHDGRRRTLTTWSAPARSQSNLRFSHVNHSERTAITCAACHAGADGRMERPRPETCLGCHGGGAHLDAADGCTQCHLEVAAVAAWDAARIGALLRPRQHAAPDFLHTHGVAAENGSCATCHARESCERCHLNGGQVPAIVALARDPRVAALVRGNSARYPTPASHDASWDWQHGPTAAASTTSCANCHARASCTTCHTRRSTVIDGLPEPRAAGPTGVTYTRAPRVHPADFQRRHAARGGSEQRCLQCHERASCDECHASRGNAAFHAPNFVARHGPEAYGNRVQCSSCHSTEVFCRSCHAETGRASQGRSRVAFHNAAPLWLMGHGQSARQSLESCASCHAQSDCARCHSAREGWGVNPHGPGFNAARMQQQNRLTCLRCHRSGSPGVS